MFKHRQISFFIEGGDNVGKTTLINHISQNFTEDYKKEFTRYIELSINKYPSKDNTEFMNVINHVLNFCDDWKVLISKDEKYNDMYSRVNNLLINTMIKDMDKSLIDCMPIGKKDSWNYIDVSDRGPLSTYLYNYKDIDDRSPLSAYFYKDIVDDNKPDDEVHNFKKFIKKYIIPKFDSICQNYFVYSNPHIDDFIANLNIIILNNNLPDIPIVSDKEENIEYKKNLDSDSELQQRINHKISEIVKYIDTEEDPIIYPFRLFYINIYDDNGMRKTTEEVYNEFKEIVFAQIMYEEAYDKLNKYNKKN